MINKEKIPQGWLGIFEPIERYVKRHNRFRLFKQMKITGVDISNGVLSLTVKNANSEITKMLLEAKDKSINTCMVCGSNKNIGVIQDGNNFVKCYDCVLKDAEAKHDNIIWYSNDDKEEVMIPYIIGEK